MTGDRGDGRRRPAALAAALICTVVLAGCEGASLPSLPKFQDLNPFAEKETPLPGKRISVIQQENLSADLAAADKPVALPPPRQSDSWAQPGGVPSNSPGHLMLGGAARNAWSASAGTGSSFYGKLTASPIVYDGKVFTLDAAGTVTAFSAGGGSAVWRTSTTPQNEKDQEGFGGGLAAEGGHIYAGTGFGYVVALDVRSGKKVWEKSVGAPIRSSPTAAGFPARRVSRGRRRPA